MDGYSSTATEAIWPLAILDCEEKRGAVRLLTRPLRKALKHLQLNGCVLPEEYSRHFYDETDCASWKTARETSDVLADSLSHCAHLSVLLREDDEKGEPGLLSASACIAAAKANAELEPAQRKKIQRKRRKAETFSFTSIGGVKRPVAPKADDVFDFDKSSAAEDLDVDVDEADDGLEPDIAFWEMNDDDCGDDTDFDPYECDHECCPCVSNKLPVHTFVEGGVEPVPLAQRTATIVLWLSADMKFLLMSLGMKCATSKHACIYCDCDIHNRQDWLSHARGEGYCSQGG